MDLLKQMFQNVLMLAGLILIGAAGGYIGYVVLYFTFAVLTGGVKA